MSALEEIKIELKGIGSILKERNSFVPKYQRSYAWKNDNVLHFLQDIGSSIQNGDSEYFLGSIVISEKDEEKPEIVDGQQRIATTCILLSAIRDYFYLLNTSDGKERSQMIFSEYLAKKDLDSLEVIPKLHLNESDHQFFIDKIISDPDSDKRNTLATRKSHERITEAAKLAKTFVSQITGVTSEPIKALILWINYLTNKSKVIVVRVPDESNAFTIFETLNDRGLALAVSDLLKNYLFYKSEDRVTEVQHNWIKMISSIESAEDEQSVINFIRYFWSSKNGVVREKDLFDKIKKSVNSKSESISFANELNEKSKVYSAILNCDDVFWDNHTQKTKNYLGIILSFNMIQIRPLLLSVVSYFSKVEIEKSFKLLVNSSVRFLIVGGLGGGALEEKYCFAAVKISKKEIVNTKELVILLRDVIPNDTQFKSAFEVASVYKNNLARYYLRTMEMVLQGEAEPEFIPNSLSDEVTLEHILPQNPSNAWGHISADEAKASYKLIGNMALLQKTINSDIGNKGFENKKAFFKDSSYKLTSTVSEYKQWGVTEISSRQKKLAELALKAWQIK